MNKQFSNKELKEIIINLYNDNNIILEDNLKRQLQKSSKTQYIKLEKYYNEIKTKITDILLSTISSRKISTEIILPKTEIITEPIKYEIEIKELKKLNYDYLHEISDLKYKITTLKNEYKRNNKLKQTKIINDNNSQISTSDDEPNLLKDKRKFNYHEVIELSSYNIIHELKKLDIHHLKQVYNKYFSKKLHRQLSIYNK